MTDPSLISAGQVLAALTPEFFESLTPIERLILPALFNVWRRPEQAIPDDDWRSFGYICGRGWGKTWGVAGYLNSGVERGTITRPGLMCTNEDRADEIQISALIETAPPWFKPERHRGGLRWPNGVHAIVFTPLSPEEPRGENLDFSWLSEIVAWQATTRRRAFDNITTATRHGRRPRYAWDTTSRGLNDVVKLLMDQHAQHPTIHRLTRGTIFDNPLLPTDYVADECRKYSGRRAREELLGEVFTGADGALWQLTKIEENRRPLAPERPKRTIGAIDPGHSAAADADPTGMVWGSLGQDGHVYATDDETDRMTPEQWGTKAVDGCIRRRAAGLVLERTGLGDHAKAPIVSAAKTRGVAVKVLPIGKPIPDHTPGVIYLAEKVARSKKLERAEGPAAETDAGRVHHVGDLGELELELCTYDGSGPSPNRLDAYCYMVEELAGLTRETRRTSTGSDVAAAQAKLREALAQIGRGARVGL